MNVLIVMSTLEAGGLETYVVNLLSVLDRTRFRVTVVTTLRRGGWHQDALRRLGVDTLFCPNPYSQIGYLRAVRRIIRERAVDVVCDFRGAFAAPTLWAARRERVRSRVVMWRSTRLGFRPSAARTLYYGLIHRCTRAWATRIIGNTRRVLDAHYPGWEEDARFAVVYNGVDLSRFRPDRCGDAVRRELDIPADRVVIGHVGRFHVSKNHPTLLAAFAALRRQVPAVQLLLVGGGEGRPDIEQTIRELGIEGSVTLAGPRRDVPDLLSAMDVFFFPSRYEGMPNALIEAMACGRTFVASRIPEIVEILPDGLQGQLCDVDDVTAYANQLAALCADPQRRQRLSEMGVRWAREQYSIEASAEALCRQWTAPFVQSDRAAAV
jgi:glycosyltransferase involved in cell wall biosynthesis